MKHPLGGVGAHIYSEERLFRMARRTHNQNVTIRVAWMESDGRNQSPGPNVILTPSRIGFGTN